jgi:hypothetical protein
MLWRQSYQTRIERDLCYPVAIVVSVDCSEPIKGKQVWIGGFGFNGLNEQEVWSKLFQSDFHGDVRVHKVFIFESVGTSELESIRALVAPSEVNQCLLIEDPSRSWYSIINPDHPGRGFAAIIEGDKIPLLMVGPPTEDAWEEFSNEWRART